MTPHDLALNCSLALRHLDPADRAATAAALGYGALEFWWPFATQTPSAAQINTFVDQVHRAGIPAVLLNFPGGGPAVADRGLLSVPGREADFLRDAETTLAIGRRIGTRFYNPMAGNVAGDRSPGSQAFETALRNLVRVAPLVEDAKASIVLEPLSGFPQAALQSFADARALVDAARAEGAHNVAVLFDLFHLAVNDDPALDGEMPDPHHIGHVQVADAPGRGWPGTGGLPLQDWLGSLRTAGYAGLIGLECLGETPRPAASAFGPE